MTDTNGNSDELRGTIVEPDRVVQVIWTPDGRIAVQHSENVGFPELSLAAALLTRAANRMQDAYEAPPAVMERPRIVPAVRMPHD